VDVQPARLVTAADFWNFQMYQVFGSTLPPTAQPATVNPIKPNLPGPIYAYDSCRAGTAMMTFDDGPEVDGSTTSRLLDALAAAGVKASFFMAPGDYTPELLTSKAILVQRMHAEGHLVGCHSWNHPDFTSPVLSNATIKTQQLDPCQSWMQSVLPGYVVTHWRPPYGDLTESQAQYISAQGYVQAYWNIDFMDYNLGTNFTAHKTGALNYFATYKRVFGAYPASAIFLMHDLYEYDSIDPVTGQHFVQWLVDYFGPSGMGYTFIKGDECYNTCGTYQFGGFCSDPLYVHYNWCSKFSEYKGNSGCDKI